MTHESRVSIQRLPELRWGRESCTGSGLTRGFLKVRFAGYACRLWDPSRQTSPGHELPARGECQMAG